MYIIRDIFHLKFGKAREAKELLGRMRAIGNDAGYPAMRCLTDFTGDAYRLVLESEFDSLGAYEKDMTEAMRTDEWQQEYRKLVPLVESSHREILRVVE